MVILLFIVAAIIALLSIIPIIYLAIKEKSKEFASK